MGLRLWAAALVGAAIIIFVSSISFEQDGVGMFGNAVAEPKAKKKRLSRCVRYGQVRGDDKQSVDISLSNRCKVPVTCSIEWRVTCDGDPADAEPRDFARIMKLETGNKDSINASAADCGDEGWAVDDIKWDCEPL